MACRRMMGWCDASAVSQPDTGPEGEPDDLCEPHDWTREGTDGFLGHSRCQGRTAGWGASRQRALLLMGVWCGAEQPTQRERQQGGV
jgi:hypothetical protein